MNTKILIVTCAMITTELVAKEWHIMEPRRVNIEAYQYQSVYDPYLSPLDDELKYGGAFNVDTDLLKWNSLGLYSLNKLHFDQSERTGHVKHGGWEYELGISIFPAKGPPKVELFKQHHSRHVFEEVRVQHFPVYDRYGVRFNIYP